MTNLERIKQMSTEELAEFLTKLDTYGDFSSHVMCSFVCGYKKDGHCTFPDEDDCATNGISPATCIQMWLISEKGDWEWMDTI